MNTVFAAKDPEFQDRVRKSFADQAVMETLGASIATLEAGEIAIDFPYHQKFTQQNGFIHAGIVSTILDSACGYAAFSLMPAEASVLTIEFKINLLAPASGERFRAVGKVKKPGRSITVSEGEFFACSGKGEKLVATMTGTLMAVYHV